MGFAHKASQTHTRTSAANGRWSRGLEKGRKQNKLDLDAGWRLAGRARLPSLGADLVQQNGQATRWREDTKRALEVGKEK